MADLLWESAIPGAPSSAALPASATRLVEAVRTKKASGLFPPVAGAGIDGVLRADRELAGDADAELIECLMRQHRFSPLVALMENLDHWCRLSLRRFTSVVAPGVLTAINGALFGPLFTEAFLVCAARPHAVARRLVRAQQLSYTAALTLFLERLYNDVRSGWFADPAYSLPVVGLTAHDAETHNGRQRVLRLDLSGGRSLAYKPRKPDGEVLFLATSGSVFELLNQLPVASGEIRLPVLDVRPGDGPYSWQEWIEPPSQWGTIRKEAGMRLQGVRLGRRQAERFWHRSGSLAAACFGFGIADLGEGNLLAGTRPGDDEPLFFPVDLEVYFTRVRRLYDTGLIADVAAGDHHHPGLENIAHWCTVEGPISYFVQSPDGALQLYRRRQPWARNDTRSVVSDSGGRTGYGPYLTSFLRGMFDAWTVICRHRERIQTCFEREACVRVIPRPTAVYAETIYDWLLSGVTPAEPYGRAELIQLRQMDVPYFFRSIGGGPLLRWDPAETEPVRVRLPIDREFPPINSVRHGTELTLAGLGAALRDAVEYVFDDLDQLSIADHQQGVHIELADRQSGQVSFDWPQVGKRIIYSWSQSTLRLRVDALAVAAKQAPEIRHKLLRIGRVDGVLRNRWTASEFTDTETEAQLRRLATAAVNWLRPVIDEHGWPGHALVGKRAADAACLLVQHIDDQIGFQKECLERMRVAAASGDIPLWHVAYLTDTICVLEGKPQIYGTKFQKEGNALVPLPIEQPDQVDQRRKSMGMQTLNRYARRLQARFSPAHAEKV